MSRAKSLLEVKDGLSFLDVIARQVLALREEAGARVPLVLMNSFATRDDSLEALGRYPDLEADLPLDFVQGKVPKLCADDLEPVSWPADPKLEWVPPGHGDLYPSLAGSGMLDAMLDRGYEYAFVSNSDNLGATLDQRILAWFARERLPFLMEAADRTESDRKGGHLARRHGGGLVLREIAQTPESDEAAFQDVTRHRYFNCNTLWVNLRALAKRLADGGGVLELPMIVNRKTVDPADPSSPAVDPARDRDGRGHRRLRGRRGRARAAQPLRARQDHGRPALAALGRLRDGPRPARGARAGAGGARHR